MERPCSHIIRSLWKGLVLIGSFYCCTIPKEVMLLLSHFEESEAQERYILGMGTNEQQQRRDLNPATLTV